MVAQAGFFFEQFFWIHHIIGPLPVLLMRHLLLFLSLDRERYRTLQHAHTQRHTHTDRTIVLSVLQVSTMVSTVRQAPCSHSASHFSRSKMQSGLCSLLLLLCILQGCESFTSLGSPTVTIRNGRYGSRSASSFVRIWSTPDNDDRTQEESRRNVLKSRRSTIRDTLREAEKARYFRIGKGESELRWTIGNTVVTDGMTVTVIHGT